MVATNGNDLINGTSNNDLIDALAGNDTVNGRGSNDTINGNDGADRLLGNDGNDLISGGTGDDFLDGGTGIDTANYAFLSSGGNYDLGAGVASFSGFSEEILNFENLRTGSGSDTVLGSIDDNRIFTGNGNDIVDGGDGNDFIDMGAGDDSLNIGSLGNDTFNGGSGNDFIDGGSGNESYFGQDSNDTLRGDLGNDRLNGGGGADAIKGNEGQDTLTGDIGSDRFGFDSPNDGVDRITDFSPSQGDKIQLDRFGFGGGLAAGSLPSSRFTIGSSATDGSDRIIYNATNGNLFFDVDGTGSIGQVQLASLDSGLAIDGNDFIVV